MSSITPFFSITASSSFFTSSKVKPYWKPEQPPPVTNTRSFSSGLPSSSISCLTLLAAPSLNTSGAGMVGISVTAASVTAFIACPLPARGELQFHALHFRDVVHEAPFNHGALMDFDAFVVHVPFDPGAGLEFEGLGGMHRPVDGAVHHDVRRLHLAVDARVGGNHQGARLVGQRRDIAAHHAVYPQPAAENHVALDARGGADQAVDAVLRLARRLVEHCASPFLPCLHPPTDSP